MLDGAFPTGVALCPLAGGFSSHRGLGGRLKELCVRDQHISWIRIPSFPFSGGTSWRQRAATDFLGGLAFPLPWDSVSGLSEKTFSPFPL